MFNLNFEIAVALMFGYVIFGLLFAKRKSKRDQFFNTSKRTQQ